MYKKCTCKGLAFGKRYYKHMVTLTVRDNDDNFLGILKYYIPKKNGTVCWIQMLIVRDNFIGKGFGSKIFNTFQSQITIKYNIDKMYLSVVKSNYRARNFWSKMGFKICDIIDINNNNKGIKSNILLIYSKPLY